MPESIAPPPVDAGPLGFALHYGNSLSAELLKRQLPRDQVRQCVLWWAVMAVDLDGLTVDQLVEEFRTQIEYIRSSGKRN